mmetsp:Transcript_37429/g.59250  ORF Transcript_37429/g.59250 Transcript_37429/m.59250 type:complete len:150 (+) Transcript_37429:1750-2199(+)
MSGNFPMRGSTSLEMTLKLSFELIDFCYVENKCKRQCCSSLIETRGLVGKKLLKLLRPDSILINCARGAIIDQESMVEMLAQKRFRAGLDVYELEPLPDNHPIRKVPESNLVSTPHLAYKCEESLLRRHDITLANILAFFADSPQNIVS